jgi:hypothetical protein
MSQVYNDMQWAKVGKGNLHAVVLALRLFLAKMPAIFRPTDELYTAVEDKYGQRASGVQSKQQTEQLQKGYGIWNNNQIHLLLNKKMKNWPLIELPNPVQYASERLARHLVIASRQRKKIGKQDAINEAAACFYIPNNCRFIFFFIELSCRKEILADARYNGKVLPCCPNCKNNDNVTWKIWELSNHESKSCLLFLFCPRIY